MTLEHTVQVFRSATGWTWHCDTCGANESGYLKAAYAEHDADYHRTESAACKETA